MRVILQLILTFDGINKYYGKIPEMFNHTNNYEEYILVDENMDDSYFDDNFIMPINKICTSLIGGDVEYLNVEQCKKLVPWIEKNINKFTITKGKEIVVKILEYANRAIYLNTGIIIDI